MNQEKEVEEYVQSITSDEWAQKCFELWVDDDRIDLPGMLEIILEAYHNECYNFFADKFRSESEMEEDE